MVKQVWIKQLWHRCIQASVLKQNTGLLILALFGLFLPLNRLYSSWEQLIRLENNINEQQRQTIYQQRLLQSLEKKAKNDLLTPQSAALLSQINQYVQSSSVNVKIQNSQWHFSSSAVLQLRMEGDFLSLNQFITDILQKFETLRLSSLKLFKPDENLVAYLTLRLQLTKE